MLLFVSQAVKDNRKTRVGVVALKWEDVKDPVSKPRQKRWREIETRKIGKIR